MPTLTFRQERFTLEYLKDQNASAAAARAGYTAKSMAAQGYELLNNPAIRERVRIEMDAMLAQIRCSALALMKQRMQAAFFDAGKLFKGGWELRAPEELDAETRAAVEVSTVTRKSGPVVRMKQPDRARALRALEKVHERLDRLNEAHYAALEKAGKVPTLEEIEAMDAAEVPGVPDENVEKCKVLSGGAAAPVHQFSVKTQVLSGFNLALVLSPQAFPENHQVLSGSIFSPTDTGSVKPALSTGARGTRTSTGSGRTVRGRENPEKDKVLSGSRLRLSPLVAAVQGVTRAFAAA